MNANKVERYVETSKALREAYEELKYGKITRSKFLAETFEPIVKPLEGLMKNEIPSIKTENVKSEPEDIAKFIGDTALKYLKMYTDKSVKTDKTFGLRTRNHRMFIGSEPVQIENNNIHFPNGDVYEGTEGLWQLLTLQKPDNYTTEDRNNYAEILLKTNAYRRNNNPDETYVKSNSGYKYSHIVKPILKENSILATGKGLQKIVTNKPVEYVYWDTLDELLEKLYIAWGEIKSGNKNPLLYNEISSILEEIREI